MSPLMCSPPLADSPVLPDTASYLAGRREAIRRHHEDLAATRERWVARHRYYYGELTRFLQFVVEPERRILQIRSDTGDVLAALRPSLGVGVDLSERLVEIARRRHPRLRFEVQDPEQLTIAETFDYVLVTSIHDIVDLQASFARLQAAVMPESRVLVMGYNALWRPWVRMAERAGWKASPPLPNWLSGEDVINLLHLAGFEAIRSYGLFLLPVYIPVLSAFLNRVVARLPLFRRLCFLYVVVARPMPRPGAREAASVSVIVPCKNERGNIEAAVRRIPEMGSGTEIIFCDDRSSDGTAEEVCRLQGSCPERDIKLVSGPGICKALNVWTGFEAATGDILMILDADLTTPPEELPYFYAALIEGRGEFINGSRLVYPMERQAMPGLNLAGNACFSWAFTFLLGQRIKDTLCGTKALWRRDYQRLKRFRGTWGVEDRWGDYELLFGAARLHVKIVDVPVHYLVRTYGETKMTSRLRNAWVMLRMCGAALVRLKFI